MSVAVCIYRFVCYEMDGVFFGRFHKSLSENPWKCSPENNNRSIVFLRRL